MAEHLASIFGTEKDHMNCPFYFKIGACRHGDRCPRLHNRPSISPTLLLCNMYQRPDMITPGVDAQGNPIDPSKIQGDFEDFYEDIFEELRKYGEIESLHVCDNLADHMIGNVYVQFREEEQAARALQALQGRFHSGRPIIAEFSPVTDFREATCRQYEENSCTRNGYCNFMHVKEIGRDLRKRLFGLIHVTRAPPKLRGLILGCCSAGNLGNIFLIIIPALCKEKGSPFGAPDVCQTYGLAYSSLSMAIGAVFLWSIVYNIVRVTSKVTELDGNAQTNQTKVLISGSTAGTVSEENRSISSDHTNECTLPLISNSSVPSTKTKVRLSERVKRFASSISGAVDFKKLFAPSTIAVIVGFIIGGIPLIRNAIIGESAPLRVLHESAELIGGGAIPSVTLIMGGNLINGLRGGASVQPSVIAGVIVVRYILLPSVGTVLVKAAVHFGLIQPDPLYQFILLLQYAVPPAMNIGTITQLFGVGESECSVIFVWVYALASVAVTIWSAFFMWTLS